jgi:hypothetical protein
MPDRHLQGGRAATTESKNIGLIYMEIFEQRSRVICGLFDAERPVCNVRAVWPYPCSWDAGASRLTSPHLLLSTR